MQGRMTSTTRIMYISFHILSLIKCCVGNRKMSIYEGSGQALSRYSTIDPALTGRSRVQNGQPTYRLDLLTIYRSIKI